MKDGFESKGRSQMKSNRNKRRVFELGRRMLPYLVSGTGFEVSGPFGLCCRYWLEFRTRNGWERNLAVEVGPGRRLCVITGLWCRRRSGVRKGQSVPPTVSIAPC